MRMEITHPSAKAVSPLNRWEFQKSPLVEWSEIPIFLGERGGFPTCRGDGVCNLYGYFQMRPTCPENKSGRK